MDESDLIQRIKDGDKSAFDEVYEKYKNMIFHTAVFIMGNRADAEEIVQECFISSYVHIQELKYNEQFKSWLYHILVHLAWRAVKRKRREVPYEELEPVEITSSNTPLNSYLLNEQKRCILEVISNLDIKYRTIIILFYFNEMKIKDIAKVTGCLEGTVKSRLFKGRKLLKRNLVEMESGKDVQDYVYEGFGK